MPSAADRRSGVLPSRRLIAAFLAHVAATLIHFVHNAVYLNEYPNLPHWLTSGGVYASWCALTAIGVFGWVLMRYVSTNVGLVTLGVYALLGFGGFDHYTVAAISAHTSAMNLTIVLEAITGSLLLIATVREYVLQRRVRAR